jgi:hypothetical protein
MAVQQWLGLLSDRGNRSHPADRTDSLVIGRDLDSAGNSRVALARRSDSAHGVRLSKAQ